jgi:hypothetical protein
MARAKKSQQVEDPNEVLHLQVKPGCLAAYDGLLYGDRATLQVRRRDLDRVTGDYQVVDPAEVPDVAGV